MNERKQKIINLLVSFDRPLTGEEFGDLLGVSSRTVRKDIKELDETIKQAGALILSAPGKGYWIQINDKSTFQTFLLKLNNSLPISDDYSTRVGPLIYTLLNQTDFIKLDQLADQFFVSRAVIQTDFRLVKENLIPYSIRLYSRPNYGVKVLGDEMNIRKCLAKYHPKDGWRNRLPAVIEMVEAKIKEANYAISDYAFENLIHHLLIAIERIERQHVIDLSKKEQHLLQEEPEYKLASHIAAGIQDCVGTAIPEPEISYITLHLIGKRVSQMSDSLEYNLQIDDLIDQVLSRMDHYPYLKEDQDLRLALSLHLQLALNRATYNQVLENPILDEIKKSEPALFNMGLEVCRFIEEILDLRLPEEEAGFLALHFGASIIRMENDSKRKVVLICSSGISSAKLLEARIQAHFEKELHIVGTYGIFQLEEIAWDQIDFVFSTVHIQTHLPKPVLFVHPLLKPTDIKAIEQALSPINPTWIDDRFIFLHPSVQNATEAIMLVGNSLINAGVAPPEFISYMFERETYHTTSYGSGVALPHPIRPCGIETVLGIAILEQPVEWFDTGDWVQIIFMLCVKQTNTDNLQSLYNFVLDTIDNPFKRKKLIEATSKSEIIELIV